MHSARKPQQPEIAAIPPFVNAANAVTLGLFGTKRRFLEFIARADIGVIKRGRDRVVVTAELLAALQRSTMIPANTDGELIAIPRAKTIDEVLALAGLQRAGGST